jgi:hypothetical protein
MAFALYVAHDLLYKGNIIQFFELSTNIFFNPTLGMSCEIPKMPRRARDFLSDKKTSCSWKIKAKIYIEKPSFSETKIPVREKSKSKFGIHNSILL